MSAEIKELGSALSVSENEVTDGSERFKTTAKDGTCSWIATRKWFLNWLQDEEDEPHILWISGPPAAGKSILASYIVDTIRRRWGDAFCQYHSFDFSNKSKRSASYLFRSLAYQVARASSPFRAKLIQMSDQFGIHFSNMSVTTLWEKIFCGGLFNMTLGKTLYWVIDGLDESEPGAIPMIFQCLKSVDSRMRLKILLVSRPTTDIIMRIKQLPFKCTKHQLSTIDTYDDIRAYVEDAVGSMIPKGVTSRQRIVDKILTKASGNFLWVALATKDLEESWHRQSNIDHTLSGFPSEMTPLYSRMMQKIEKHPLATRNMATTFLIWATYSFRPLHVKELKIALQAEFPDLTSLEDTIHHICGDFVQVRNSEMSLIHETARYFLVNNHTGAVVSMTSTSSHEYLATVCLQYLSSNKERQWRQILNIAEIRRSKDTSSGGSSSMLHEMEPFLSYAATFWAYHLSLARPDSQSLRDILSAFFDNDALTWINALALLGDLKSLMKAAQYLKTFIRNRERVLSETIPRNFQGDDIEFLKLWTVDLIKIVGKFGINLAQHPSSIYRLIPPLCPANSIIRKTFGHGYGSFSVTGVSFADWDDCHARLSVSTDETGSKVIATVEVFAALVPQAQSLVVWHAETCEELRRMCHGEYVTEVAVNRKGDLVCTSGLKTIKIWELGTGRGIGSVEKHSDNRVLALAFGTDDDHILVGYQDHLIACQNWRTGELIHAFRASFKGDKNVYNGLRCVSFNPDGTQVAVASRARPVELWDLGTESRTHRCIMKDEISHSENDIFQQTEVIQWHPDSGNIYILYHNTTLIDWNPVYDEQTEHQLGAKGMVISPCGRYLLTSDHDGSVKVFRVPDYSRAHAPEFCPIYHLEYHEYVRDLAFSPDGQRFYDLRGSVCSVWEPEALVPAEKPDAEDDRTSSSGSLWTVETIKSSATSHNRATITSIACAPNDLGFCCGGDDGTITIHEMATSKRIRSLPGHASEMAIIGLTWSSSGNFIASGDDSGHVLVRKVQIPTSGNSKMTIYKPSDFRIRNDGINQLLFSSNDKYLLVSTFSADRIWDVSAKRICHTRTHPSPRHIKWIEHPKDPSRLVSIDAGEVHIFDWVEFADLTPGDGLRFAHHDSITGERKIASPMPSTFEQLALGQSRVDEIPEIVNCITQTKDKRSIIFETLPSGGHDRDRNKRRRIELIRTADVDPVVPERLIVLEGSVQELAREVSKLVGSYQNQVVFFNHQHWLCTWEIGTAVKDYKRHLFLPKDWISSETLSLNALGDHGTLLCPRNGEVAIIKNGIRF
jgi:WD40 repeat protein